MCDSRRFRSSATGGTEEMNAERRSEEARERIAQRQAYPAVPALLTTTSRYAEEISLSVIACTLVRSTSRGISGSLSLSLSLMEG
jgi:hypothetical protein